MDAWLSALFGRVEITRVPLPRVNQSHPLGPCLIKYVWISVQPWDVEACPLPVISDKRHCSISVLSPRIRLWYCYLHKYNLNSSTHHLTLRIHHRIVIRQRKRLSSVSLVKHLRDAPASTAMGRYVGICAFRDGGYLIFISGPLPLLPSMHHYWIVHSTFVL